MADTADTTDTKVVEIVEETNVQKTEDVDEAPKVEVESEEVIAEKKTFGKRPLKTFLIHFAIWLVLTAYIIALGILGVGKSGYELGIIIYIFITLRLLAQHVSMEKLIYVHIGKVYNATWVKAGTKLAGKWWIIIGFILVLALLIIVAVASPVTATSGTTTARLQSVVGIVVMLVVLYIFSSDRKAIPWHTVVAGLLIQYVIALFVLRTEVGINIFSFISTLVTDFLEASDQGASFIFGSVAKGEFARSVFPAIVFFCSVVYVVYYLGGMQYVVGKLAWLFVRLMDTSGAEACVAVASPFVGQGESALLVKPFVDYMTQSELHSVMTSGFATISGSVLLAYVGYVKSTSKILTSCVMSIPASMAVSKMRFPEKETPMTKGKVTIPPSKEREVNVLHAAGNGAGIGIQLVLLIGASLLAILSLYYVVDYVFGWLFHMIGVYDWIDSTGSKFVSIQLILSYVFAPIAWCLGIPWVDARKSGEFMALKMVVNEFSAYSTLSSYIYTNDTLNGNLQQRSIDILAFALCGFANIGSIGIQIGILGAMAPSRASLIAKLAVSAMLVGTVSTWLSAAVAGVML